MGNEWVAKRLEMGHDKSVSSLIRQGREHREVKKACKDLPTTEVPSRVAPD